MAKGKKRGKKKSAAPRARKPVRKAVKLPKRRALKRKARPLPAPQAAAPLPAVTPRLAEPLVPPNFHALYDRGLRASRGVTPSRAAADSPGHRRLRAEIADLEVHYDQATMLPNLVVTRTPASRLSGRAAASPEDAATAFVRSRGDLWDLTPDDAATVEVVSVSAPNRGPDRRAGRRAGRASTFDVSRLRTVNLIQRIAGREVFNSEATAAVNANNEVVSVSGQFFPGAAARGAPGSPTSHDAILSTQVESAIARAAFDLSGAPYEAVEFVRAADREGAGPYRFYDYVPKPDTDRPPFDRPVRVKDVMFPLGEREFVPGYYMELWIKGLAAFSYVMDAIDTPDVLYRNNLTAHAEFKYRVHNTGDAVFRPHDGPAPGTPHPTGVPDGFQAPTLAETLVTLESLLPGDPWLPDGATTTDGNNCTAYADLRFPAGFGQGDVMGAVTGSRTFDYTYEHGKPASDPNNLQNSVVGMFFHVNWLHDRWYEAGFDEASGNAQKSNFGRGGVDGDPILAQGNHFSATDNAGMSTPADGDSPRMEMYEFLGPRPAKPSRTSNHEALITFHEMGHYITNRLVGNGNGLTNRQGRAMGEGWGDFFAICMTSQATDDFANGVFAVGGWTDWKPSFDNNYYFSIRRYPYSADIAKNPLTFKHISSNVVLPSGPTAPPIRPVGGGNNAVHNAGEVWAVTLWNVFVNLVAKYGHAEAEERMLAFVIGGLKLTPVRPTFLQARDAILAAVATLDQADLPEVKAGFAKRGMGQGAVGPLSGDDTLAGVVEGFVP